MAFAQLLEAIQSTSPPFIVGRSRAALDAEDGNCQSTEYGSTSQDPISEESLSAEIARLDASSKRTFRRRYRKLCEKTRAALDHARSLMPGVDDVPDDHRAEAYFHDRDEHYATAECGYCLIELFNNALREGRCVCAACDNLRNKYLHYTGACACLICGIEQRLVLFDDESRNAGLYAVPVIAVAASLISGRKDKRCR